MTRTEPFRRVAVWGCVVVFFGLEGWSAVNGDPTGLLAFSGFAIVGAVILTVRPGNGVGRYLLGVVMFWLILRPEAVLGELAALPPALEAIQWGLSGLFWPLLLVIGIVFPTGRPQTRLGRVLLTTIVAFGAVMAVNGVIATPVLESDRANPLAAPGAAAVLGPVADALAWLLALCGILIVVDLAMRWRRSRGVERLQYRWFVFGLVTSLALLVLCYLWLVLVLDFQVDTPAGVVFSWVSSLVLNIVPVTIGVAITRHGLYEIGRVVSRTVTYAIAVTFVVGVYALVVVSVSWLLPALPAIGVALATLAAAALFLPALRRVRRAVERRFDRERYDAGTVVDAFGERLRTAVDPAATAPDLVAAVEQTLAPASVGLWTPGRGS